MPTKQFSRKSRFSVKNSRSRAVLEENPNESYQTRPESDRVSIRVILSSWLLAILLCLFSVDENHGENGLDNKGAVWWVFIHQGAYFLMK